MSSRTMKYHARRTLTIEQRLFLTPPDAFRVDLPVKGR